MVDYHILSMSLSMLRFTLDYAGYSRRPIINDQIREHNKKIHEYKNKESNLQIIQHMIYLFQLSKYRP